MITSRLALACTLSLALVGCGDDSADGDAEGGAGGGSAEGGSSAGGSSAGGSSADGGSGGGGVEGQWVELVAGEWSLEPGGEMTSDVHTVVLDRDIFVGAIRPIAPEGTHHTLLGINGLIGGNMIYASGVDTNALVFPEGVGLRFSAGDTLVLQLHVFNPTGAELSGKSGIEVIEIAPEDVVNEAEVFLPGPMDLSIPPNQEHSQSGTCTVNQPTTLFALFPHMHQLGTHLKTTVNVGGTSTVLHDGPFTFEHQPILPLDSIALDAGDTITTECTWNNSTSQTVGWGESSNSEMCFSILYRYPAQGNAGFCPN